MENFAETSTVPSRWVMLRKNTFCLGKLQMYSVAIAILVCFCGFEICPSCEGLSLLLHFGLIVSVCGVCYMADVLHHNGYTQYEWEWVSKIFFNFLLSGLWRLRMQKNFSPVWTWYMCFFLNIFFRFSSMCHKISKKISCFLMPDALLINMPFSGTLFRFDT